MGKADLNIYSYWDPERKLGVAGHILEIIKQQLFKKAIKCKAMNGVFIQTEALLSVEKCMVTPQFLFWIPRALARFSFLHIVLNRAKISLCY